MISTPSMVDLGFSDALSRSIEDTFRDLVGERAKNALFSQLERQGIRREEIPESLRKFETFLEHEVGRAGPVIGKQIAKRFYHELGLELFENPNLALSDYVHIAMQRTHSARNNEMK